MDCEFIFSGQSRDPVGFVVVGVFYQGDRNALKRPLGKPAADLVRAVSDNNHKSRDSGFLTRGDDVLEKRYAPQGYKRLGNSAGHRCNPAPVARSENQALVDSCHCRFSLLRHLLCGHYGVVGSVRGLGRVIEILDVHVRCAKNVSFRDALRRAGKPERAVLLVDLHEMRALRPERGVLCRLPSARASA